MNRSAEKCSVDYYIGFASVFVAQSNYFGFTKLGLLMLVSFWAIQLNYKVRWCGILSCCQSIKSLS